MVVGRTSLKQFQPTGFSGWRWRALLRCSPSVGKDLFAVVVNLRVAIRSTPGQLNIHIFLERVAAGDAHVGVGGATVEIAGRRLIPSRLLRSLARFICTGHTNASCEN